MQVWLLEGLGILAAIPADGQSIESLVQGWWGALVVAH